MMEPNNFHVEKKPEKKTKTYYKECLKNHAASIGGNATDGCGEFMPSGGDGTPESLKCSACNCHRNFHRKFEAESSGSNHHHHYNNNILSLVPNNKSGSTSPSDCEDGVLVRKVEDNVAINKKRKRFRTKFTKEQKERMLGFAEEAGWRIQKLDESVVQRFCQEVGIKRRVLKVWMHNNKNTFANKNVHLPN